MHLVVSIGLFVLGICIIRRTSNHGRKAVVQLDIANHYLRTSNKQHTLKEQELEQRITNLLSQRALDIQITKDAIMREERAKAALLAVLKQNGCSEDQIATVMSKVDGTEEGDL